MENICLIDKCTGCSACYNICSKNAIRMGEDKLGFLRPQIDTDLCVKCGLCMLVCPVNYPISRTEPLHAIAAVSKDIDDLMSSTSGGASSVLVNSILQRGGIVYGCVQHNYRTIFHTRITTIEEAFALKGSKYVQSEIGFTFRKVKEDLLADKEVLYIGTPCQIAGLKKYLRKEYSNLYLVDLVCHGVPSQKYLKADVDSLLDKYKGHIEKAQVVVHFREKTGRKQYYKYGMFLKEKEKGTYEDYNLISIESPHNNYIAGFMTGHLFRESCFSCPYANRKRGSDITLADFWGLGANGKSRISRKKGVSLLLLNTGKGKNLFFKSKDRFYYEERTVDEAVKGNGQLMCPSSKPADVEQFRNLYIQTGDFSVISSFLVGYRKKLRREKLLSYIPLGLRIYRKLKRITRKVR